MPKYSSRYYLNNPKCPKYPSIFLIFFFWFWPFSIVTSWRPKLWDYLGRIIRTNRFQMPQFCWHSASHKLHKLKNLWTYELIRTYLNLFHVGGHSRLHCCSSKLAGAGHLTTTSDGLPGVIRDKRKVGGNLCFDMFWSGNLDLPSSSILKIPEHRIDTWHRFAHRTHRVASFRQS